MDFLTDTVFAEFERSDFIGGIDNEALDFGHLDQFIHVATATGQPPTPGAGNGGNGATTTGTTVTVTTPTPLGAVEIGGTTTVSAPTQSHLPESPPDSGSEPPYSPADLQGLTLAASGNNGTTGSNSSAQQIAISHSITTVPTAIQQPGTPQQNLSSDLTTLTDISQASIDLNSVTHHHNHLSILNSHHHHHQQNQQHHHHHHHHHPNALYIRTDLPADQQVVNSGITIRKDEDILLTTHQPDPQLILQQTGANILDLERNYTHPQSNLLSLGPVQINSDDLSRLMPEVYAPGSHSTTSVPVPVPQRPNITTPVNTRKRKLSQADIGTSIVKPEPGSSLSPICQQHLDPGSPVSTNLPVISSNLSIPDTSLDSSIQNPDSTDPCPLQCIRFTPFQQQNWHVLCDQSLQELPVPHYRVDADKGFNFSNSDDAFVCQKKNHFQITCHAQLQGSAAFVRTSSGLEKIKSFHLHFYGVKLEAPNHTIRVEQSQSDRSKKPFHPVPIDLQNRLVSKVTVGRLHFSETTSNNMRKKGRPNPEQRYFQLVVGLHAHTHSGHFPVVSQGSERIIVRASNPGQFESDVELCWQRGVTQESIYHAGRVGINTDRPDESLVVHGNLKVSGHIVQPSDSRAKQEISELDTSEQLRNLQKIRIVKYRYEPQFAVHSGLKGKNDKEEIVDTGVIAQEVREVLPDAVQEAGSIVLPNGQVIENFLLVNKDRILMENIGAVKELCKVTGSLETRIEQLEKINSRLVRIQKLDRNHNCKTKKCKHIFDDYDATDEICSNKTIQMIIIILVIIMAICLAAISTLYFVEHSKQRDRYFTHFSRYISQESIIFNPNNGYIVEDRRHHNHDTYKSNSLMNSFTVRTPQYPAAGTVTPLNGDIQSILRYQHHINDHIFNNISPNTSKVGNNNLKLNTIKWSSSAKDDDEQSASDETSEKAAETIILPQDVENNSIDGDNQKPQNKLQYNSQKLQNNTIVPDFGKELQPITNKSRADSEDTDLQYLSNNSESEDQALIEIVNSPTLSKAIPVDPIGLPSHCETTKAENILCQSACCEETNNLSIQMADIDQSNHNSYEVDNNSNTTSKSLSGQNTLLKTLINDEQPIELRDTESVIEVDEHRSRKVTENKRKTPPNDRKPARDCFPIVFWIRSETFNVTLGTETICLNGGQNQNITYSIPVSKYMKETKVELHFSGSNSLQWALCSTKEHTTRNYIAKAPETTNNIDIGNKVFQRNSNKSVFYVNIPSCGYFERLVELRASFDAVKNTCQEQGDDVNTLLQYNIRLFRECE